ncbi:MAG: cohesin domain-containing protein [Pirellulaceae bacterium]|nr:cohesin domain-containing protein [Pirellulaceae bacterium]
MLSHVLAHDEAPAVHVEIADLAPSISAAEFTAPVNISDGQGLRGAEIRLSYDTTLLSADRTSVHAGSIWPSHDTMVFANVDDDNGTIVAWLFRTEELDAGSGSLLDVVFRTTAVADSDVTTSLDLTSVRLNEGRISVAPTPQPGADETDGVARSFGQSSLDHSQVPLLDQDASSAPLGPFVAPSGLVSKESSVEAGWSRSILRIGAELEAERVVPIQPSKPNVCLPLPAAPQTFHQTAQPIPQVDPAQQSVTPQPGRYMTYAFPSEPTSAQATNLAHRRIIGPLPADAPASLLPTDALDFVLRHTESWLPGSP